MKIKLIRTYFGNFLVPSKDHFLILSNGNLYFDKAIEIMDATTPFETKISDWDTYRFNFEVSIPYMIIDVNKADNFDDIWG